LERLELKIKKTPKDLQKSKIFSNFAGDFRNKNYKKLFPKLLLNATHTTHTTQRQ
jgi:hypothetical protein